MKQNDRWNDCKTKILIVLKSTKEKLVSYDVNAQKITSEIKKPVNNDEKFYLIMK